MDGGIHIGVAGIRRILVARFGPKEDLLASLEDFNQKEGVKSGVILSGVGSLEKICLRNPRGIAPSFPITDAHRYIKEYHTPGELTSLDGNVALSPEGNLVVHAHITVSLGDRGGEVVGGHLAYGTIIYSTAEIVIAELSDPILQRKIDPLTKMPELSAG